MEIHFPRPEFVLFDYGETLAHEADYCPEAGFAALLAHARSNPHGINAPNLSEAFRSAFQDLRRQAHAAGLEIPNRLRWRWLFECFELEFDLDMDALETLYWNAAAPCQPTPGMGELLRRLREMNIGTGVVSNMGFTGQSLRARLEKLFPEHSFRFVLSSADYVLRKPNPRLFALAVQKAACPAERCWFLGDNLLADIAGAAAAGLNAVYYDRDLGCAYREAVSVEPMPRCLRITDWSELYPYFEK